MKLPEGHLSTVFKQFSIDINHIGFEVSWRFSLRFLVFFSDFTVRFILFFGGNDSKFSVQINFSAVTGICVSALSQFIQMLYQHSLYNSGVVAGQYVKK